MTSLLMHHISKCGRTETQTDRRTDRTGDYHNARAFSMQGPNDIPKQAILKSFFLLETRPYLLS